MKFLSYGFDFFIASLLFLLDHFLGVLKETLSDHEFLFELHLLLSVHLLYMCTKHLDIGAVKLECEVPTDVRFGWAPCVITVKFSE
jgi:hypothetical protein